MPNLLPTVFIVLGAFALVLTLYWLWVSLRGAFIHVDGLAGTIVSHGSAERASLLEEKNALLVALKDLESERENGKLSEGDFKELNLRYRTRAREVLRALDAQIAPHRPAARAMLRAGATRPAAGSLDGTTSAPSAGGAAVVADAMPSPATGLSDRSPRAADGGSAAAPRTGGCVACGTSNDVDAVFCKKCGLRLQAEATS